ncbi:pimeloyl-ACP methyl ester carboxylesterase [Solirubrobacter pauli]|uniref:prolyl aminopeptidase n=1 Tax=Solirubrobacter pauli TaxID=166793 RepID=A0A660KX91_9ACTN|nr:alpha/beta fold hydrolase [Solirubrobacter pauli]RKQ86266.1 pimeloyl-ACP methyl ester carboxylesterase [Solirubrobacter pauli]
MRLLAAVLLVFAAFAAPAVAATECPSGARCGKIDVPVDRSGAVAGTFPIAYATLPATGPRVGTVFFLAGGPGEAAIIYTTELATELAPIRDAYDIVVVDQRGTGRSGEVDCRSGGGFGDDAVEGCAKELGKRRAFLTTEETARDLEDLRAALGLEKIVPLGVSYGTKVAGEYARRFPERTAAVVLDSPTGVGPIDLLFLQGIAAAPRVLREACATGPCAESVKDAAVALYAAVKRVGGRGLPAQVGPAELAEKTRIKEDFVLNALLLGDADAGLRADLPAALLSLSRGDTAPATHLLERLIVAYAQAPDEDDEDESTDEPDSGTSRYLATACLEAALPWATTSAPATRRDARRAYIRQLGPGPFAPFKPSTVWDGSPLDLCLNWPATPAPEPVPEAGPDVPVLVLSGRADLRTPLELATRVAADYPRATLLDVPHVGHSVISADRSGCAVRGLETFLNGAAPAPCTAAAAVPAARYLPASARGLSARQAARSTVDALLHDLVATRVVAGRRARYELLGLRGGEATVRNGRLTLSRVAWFRGVRVTGSVSAKTGKGRVTVTGPGKQRRTVRL